MPPAYGAGRSVVKPTTSRAGIKPSRPVVGPAKAPKPRWLEPLAILLASVIGFTLVRFHHQAHFDPHIAWDGFNLPAFDAHVYVAMAEEPRVFTLGPWGYRILLPGLLGATLPPRLIVPGFEWMARASLVFASGLLFVYLRTCGATLRAALLAVLAILAAPPIGAVFENPFLVEPFALVLLLFSLIVIEGAAGAWLIALALVLLSLSKEIWVLLLPLVFWKELQKNGAGAAGLRTLGVAAPAVWVTVLLRWMWVPQAGALRPGTDYLAALGAIASNVRIFAPEFLLGGLSLAAGFALYHKAARAYLQQHALTLLPLLLLPLVAATYTGEGAATSFFAADVRRLLIYSLPFVAAVAVHLDPGHSQPRNFGESPLSRRLAGGMVIALGFAPLALDRYSRIDLSTSRDGPYVLGFVRETLKTARKLDRGETVILDPAERKFAWGVSPPNELSRLRFFLRDGFGPLAHYGIHEIKMRETSATLVVPLLEPRPVKVKLTIDARESAWISVLAGGSQVGEALVGPQAVEATFELPAGSVFRGDNKIELRCEKARVALPRILRLELIQAKH